MSSGSDDETHARVDSMAPESAERLAAVLDVPRAFRTGDELPLLWHWAYFSDAVPQSKLGADGHPTAAGRRDGAVPAPYGGRRLGAAPRTARRRPSRKALFVAWRTLRRNRDVRARSCSPIGGTPSSRMVRRCEKSVRRSFIVRLRRDRPKMPGRH